MTGVLGIIDDDSAVLESLTALFETRGYVVHGFETAQALLDLIGDEASKKSFDCLIVDLRMPGMTGIELQRRLSQSPDPPLPIIVITAFGEVRSAVEAVKLGAEDFIEKPFEDDALVEAVATAIQRSRPIREKMEARNRAILRLSSLSPREREILSLVAAGAPSKVIADDLGISRRTVEIHRTNIMRKVEAQNLAELIGLVYLAESRPRGR
ncbi:response regulator transcription factor [Jiella mangrovi]|uniref:Response regulator transcription factor n=1 Tax=Jiella mangrovi TaxID=2821407 RepID=A0ABS4BE79_9HYPH|nr:response regulator [Jiella mangrovi]MBP0614481.1 response regulator transcription factor [Jiella mangrovi]